MGISETVFMWLQLLTFKKHTYTLPLTTPFINRLSMILSVNDVSDLVNWWLIVMNKQLNTGEMPLNTVKYQ